MSRSKNVDQSVQLRITVLPVIRDWLTELARHGVYGHNPAEVAEHFVREGVNRELRGEGLLRKPPTRPRRK